MKKLLEFFKNKWFIFGICALCWILFVIWLGNFWWLLGLGVIFDMCITQKVPWAFWKLYKPKSKFGNWLMGWVDAIIFAVIAASFIRIFFFEAYTIPTSSMEGSMLVGDYLFVSKCNYGPRKPMTPISFPFVHHSMPFSNGMTKAYSEVWKRPYERMGGFDHIKNDDIVVFNFPEGDTVILTRQNQSYYQIKRDFLEEGEVFPISQYDYNRLNRIKMQHQNQDYEKCFYEYFKDSIVVRPVDKRENYIKRCVAIPGDTLEIKGGRVFINGTPQKNIPTMQFRYDIVTTAPLKPSIFEKLDVREYGYTKNGYIMLLNDKQVAKLKTYKSVQSIIKGEFPDGFRYKENFPHDVQYNWNKDYFGPLVIPKIGITVAITTETLPLYKRIITLYEGNTLRVDGETIYINERGATEYTFKQNYYWMMGDNRDNSQDSRFWGFVPEDHIVGKAVMIWFSSEQSKSIPSNIRWNRMFNMIHKD